MEADHSSETSMDFYRTTCRHTPEYSTLHRHRWENLKSNISDYGFTLSRHIFSYLFICGLFNDAVSSSGRGICGLFYVTASSQTAIGTGWTAEGLEFESR
jgi:hypothetical protein